jgi:hypothetical protein
MDFGRSDQRGAYREAMRELADVGESPDRLPPAEFAEDLADRQTGVRDVHNRLRIAG